MNPFECQKIDAAAAKPIRLLVLAEGACDSRLGFETFAEYAQAEFETTRVDLLDQALESLALQRFDAVLADLSRRDGTALDTVIALAANAPALPLVVTGPRDDELARAAIRHGAQDFLIKGESSWAMVARALLHAVERKRLEAGQRGTIEALERHQAVSQLTNEGIVTIDQAGTIVGWNRGAANIFGYANSEIEGQPLITLLPQRFRCSHRADLHRMLSKAAPKRIGKTLELTGLRKDATEFSMELALAKWEVAGKCFFAGAIRDISESRVAEQQIQRLANFDSLTGLPNWTSAFDDVGRLLIGAQLDREPMALMFLDIDHFMKVKHSLGHPLADTVLVVLVERLGRELRKCDTLWRLGGDEFMLALPGADAVKAALFARKLMEIVSETVQIDRRQLTLTMSIGVAMYPEDAADIQTLSRCADIALHHAKLDGRNQCHFFTPELGARSTRSVLLEYDLPRAIGRNELSLYYQPQFCMESGAIIGAEALLRWRHPELGMVSPAEFIPLAESSGQILPIGEWVLRTAAAQWKRWLDVGMAPITLAVNLSAVQFKHSRLTQLVMQILEEQMLAPQHLELELTEGVAMDDPLAAIATMENLHRCGIRMSIDDFGTGYSSLSYLKRFKVYKLKIDQSFVRDVTRNAEDKAIVNAIISLAGNLGMRTIAEGVETAEQQAFLRGKGCHEVQGYYFSRPLTAENFEAFVREGQERQTHSCSVIQRLTTGNDY